MTEVFTIVPAPPRPLWFLASIGGLLVVLLALFGYVAFSSQATRYEISADGLAIRGTLYGRTLPWSSLRLDETRAVDPSRSAELQPTLRTNGVGLPGYGAGWFRLRKAGSGLLFVTDPSTVVALPTRHPYTALLSVAAPEAFLAALHRAHDRRRRSPRQGVVGAERPGWTPPEKEVEMDTVTSADGTRIAYWRSGEGPPLLLVHGATADHTTTWRFVLPLLERRFTVLAMDRRGRGGSGDVLPYALQREAEDVAAVIDAVGEPVNVLGHSYGALCAVEAALLTQNVRRLVLYEGVPLRGADGYPPGLIDRLEALLEAGDVEGVLVAMFRDLVEMPAEELELIRAQRDAWEVRLRNAPTLPREMRSEANYAFDPERFRGLQTPTFLVVGGDSPTRERANAAGVAAALPNASVVVLPGQQHAAMYAAPDAFAAEVVRILEP